MSGLGSGFVNLFKSWGRGIGNAADNFLLGADARKAISDEVGKKFKPKIERVLKGENRKAANIKDLDAKLTQSKKDLADAQKAWQDKYNSELADAQTKRQLDIDNYNAQSKKYDDALDKANASRQSIFDNLYDDENNYDRFHTIFTDVNTGERFILNHITGQPESLTKAYKRGTPKQIQELKKAIQGYGDRLYDRKSNKVINVFDESNINTYQGKNNIFDSYYSNKISTHNADIRNAEKQIQQAWNDSTNWTYNNRNPPKAWGKKDLNQFEQDFENNNAKPTYSFNGQNYSDETALDAAYQKALDREQSKRNLFKKKASNYASERDAEIAQRIQDAKDIKKAKLALGGALGAGALYAGAKAMYGGDDTDTPDNTDNTNNIDNTDNTYTGESDPDFNVEKEGQAILKDRQQVDTGFDPDKAEAKAILAGAAYDTGVEDGNSIRSSGDLGNNIAATTGGHTMEDRLYELIKAMEDPYKADAVANYIYSRHGDDPDVQRLGWRGWLNKYYGDSLRSIMNRDPSGYKGMHISGGL